MRPNLQAIRWTDLRGADIKTPAHALRPDIATEVLNVELVPGSLGRRRPGFVLLDMTSGPTDTLYHVFPYRPTTTTPELWAISGTASAATAHRYRIGDGWLSVTLLDTAAAAAGRHFAAAALNNKLFLAYNSAVNRLHVHDTSAGTGQLRLVGIAPSAAPSIANTGAGAYAATERYYRIGWRIKVGSVVRATAELSSATAFTPSGTGTHARITKPTTPDNATHWVVYGNTEDVYDTYKELSEIAVGTTTYDDNETPADYEGEAPAEVGLNIPPPSCKFIVSDGNRLIMAGVHETSGSAGQTPPQEGFVYVTRVMGSSEQGDDESIPHTSRFSYRIAVAANDSDRILGLSSPMDGVIYVFKQFSIHQLIPTGNDLQPYVVQKFADGIGLQPPANENATTSHHCIVAAVDEQARPVLYFPGTAGHYRISSAAGLEYVGRDLAGHNSAGAVATGGFYGPLCSVGFYDPTRRQAWWLDIARNVFHVYTPSRAVRTEDGWTGGWALYSLDGFTATWEAAAVFEITGWTSTTRPVRIPVIGGVSGGIGRVMYVNEGSTLDQDAAFTSRVTSKVFLPGDGWQRTTLGRPLLEASVDSVVPTVSLIVDYGLRTRSAAARSIAATGTETRTAVVIEGVEDAAARAVQLRVAWAATQTATVDALTVPYQGQEVIP
jgi:hypothetical protein